MFSGSKRFFERRLVLLLLSLDGWLLLDWDFLVSEWLHNLSLLESVLLLSGHFLLSWLVNKGFDFFNGFLLDLRWCVVLHLVHCV